MSPKCKPPCRARSKGLLPRAPALAGPNTVVIAASTRQLVRISSVVWFWVQNTIGRVMRQMHSVYGNRLRRAAGKIDDYQAIASAACPIAVYTGTSSSERVSFRQINKKTRKMRRGASGRRRCSLGQLNVSIDHRVADATHDVHASTNKCSSRPQG